jgi:hypothetical protein
MELRDLLVRRLQAAPGELRTFHESRTSGFDGQFIAWRQRIQAALVGIFGDGTDYPRRFSNLYFCLPRVSVGRYGPPPGTPDDDEIFERDALIAQQLFADALEEIDLPESVSARASRAEPPDRPPATIVVNVNNVLSQTVAVHLSQVIASLDDLGLEPTTRAEAIETTNKLAAETIGAQRWPELAKHLDRLKALGRPIYEKVALPLLLEMLKKQAGL